MNPRSVGYSFNPLTFLSPDSTILILLGATGTIPIDQFHRWWSLLAANYLHGSVVHIAFNMIAIKQLAPLVIREYGGHRMFVIYTLGGVAGFLVSYLAGIRLTIGASAAFCGLMGAILYYGKSRGGAYGQAVYKQVGGWAMTMALFGFLVPGINNWGHGGGMAAGVLLGYLLGYRERKPATRLHKMLGLACVVVTGATLVWAIVVGIFNWSVMR